ncbi:cold-shock protein [Nocardia miyunensis]|uniref:cold-shock protein n=1 Tax=Nocardia miyunensis TaxID=282684 RepID=UPI0008355FB3|nr:cold shock domain-containing protein [Nocardia miyunensis]
MTDTKDIFPAGSDADRAEQNTLIRDRESALDGTRMHPLAEKIRTAFERAEITDRIDQAWIAPLDCDDETTTPTTATVSPADSVTACRTARIEPAWHDPHDPHTHGRGDLPRWQHGHVAWFNPDKGIGFLTPDTGPAVLVGSQAIDVPGIETLATGQPVVFTATDTPHGPEASHVVPYTRTSLPLAPPNRTPHQAHEPPTHTP